MHGSAHSNLRKSMRAFARDAIYEIGRLPVLRHPVSAAQRRRFETAAGGDVRLFDGIYPDFASAVRAIPAGRAAGYDNERSASRALDEWLKVHPSDYPVLFWLSRLIPTAPFVFDWGGNVGIKYFAYRKYLSYPASLTWLVSDVPAVVAAGEEIGRREAATGLRFTTALDELANADILLAAGALQYIEDPIRLLRALPSLPEHIVLSKVPAYDAASAVTLQNIGTAFCAYHLFNRTEFVRAFIDLGYLLVDRWTSPEIRCEIPLHPNHAVPGYSGFYFTRSGAGESLKLL